MFYALAIVCDDFFVPSLEKICEVSRGDRRDLGSHRKARLGLGGLGQPRTWDSSGPEEGAGSTLVVTTGHALTVATAKPGFDTPRAESAGAILSLIWSPTCHRRPGPLVSQQAVTGEAKPAP